MLRLTVFLPRGYSKDKKEALPSRAEIAKGYLCSGWVVPDALSALPIHALGLLHSVQTRHYLLAFKFARALRLREYVLQIEKYAKSKRFRLNQTVWNLSKLLVSVIIVAHIIACGWFLIGYHTSSEYITRAGAGGVPYTYLNRKWTEVDGSSGGSLGLVLASTSHRYVRSLHWALLTVLTVGFGDITPRLMPEMVYAMLVCFVGAYLMGDLIGSMGALVSNLDITATIFQRKQDMLARLIHMRGISPQLAQRIANYSEYVWRRQRGFMDNTLLFYMPEFLRVKVVSHLLKPCLENFALVRNISEPAEQALLLRMQACVFAPKDFLFIPGMKPTVVYLVVEGTIDIKSPTVRTRAHSHPSAPFFLLKDGMQKGLQASKKKN